MKIKIKLLIQRFKETNIVMNFSKPIDMPRSTHYGNNYYTVYSKKLHRICQFYSNLEYFNFLSLEISPIVETFCEQPLKIEIIQDNKLKYAILDMWVRYRNGKEEFQEVKYSSELTGDSPESIRSKEQIRREEQWCKENGVDFVIRTEKTISQGRFFLNNANIIAARIRRYTPHEDKYYNPRIIAVLQKYEKISIEDLINNGLLPLNSEIDHLCYMYEKGLIDMNISSQPLGGKTEVSLWQK